MIIIHNTTRTTRDSIAAPRYVLPIARETSPLAAAPQGNASASRKLTDEGQVAAGHRRLAADATRLKRLVIAASTGDGAAVAQLVERFAPRVRAVASRHRLAPHDVEDVMQTTWLRLLEHVHTIRNPNALGAWLETTARRQSLRVLEANSREHPTDDDALFDAPAPPVDARPLPVPERWTAALAAALAQLPRHQRELLTMLVAHPSPRYAEVSHALGIPIGSIGPTRKRSLARLREDQVLRNLAEEFLLAPLG